MNGHKRRTTAHVSFTFVLVLSIMRTTSKYRFDYDLEFKTSPSSDLDF